MERVKFFFDPRCPWCYQTSRWARRLEDLGTISLDWAAFSLEVVNLEDGVDPLSLEATGSPALRTVVAIRSEHGAGEVRRFYEELGRLMWEEPPPPADPVSAVRSALSAAGLSADLCDEALADPKTWATVVEETQWMISTVGKLGVPAIVLEDGAAIFGPVVSDMPTDEDAVALWEHTSWLARYANFGELKRKRLPQTDLPGMDWLRAQRAAAKG